MEKDLSNLIYHFAHVSLFILQIRDALFDFEF